jgi:arylsulfatase A-like enzyme
MITPLGSIDLVGYATELITEQTLAWLEHGRDRNKPFMLMMHHKAPHRPWDPAPGHLKDFADTEFPEPETLFDDYKNRASAAAMAEMRIADHMEITGPDIKAWDWPRLNSKADTQARNWFYNRMTVPQHKAWKESYLKKNEPFYSGDLKDKELTRWKYQRYMQDYLGCVASVDESVGEVLDYLDKNGLTENTIVVFCSDQGMYLGEHGWFDKRFMYEESLRTPLLVRWPGVTKPGAVDDHIVSNVDFAETFLDAAGVEVPGDMQGRSFVPLLAGVPLNNWRTSFYYHYYEGFHRTHAVCEHYGVTDGQHKLIHYYKIDEWELFDLEKDPQELYSVYGKAEYASIQQQLLRELERLRTELQVTSNDPT